MIKIAYLCLQATREGQASHAHVHEIINGLKSKSVEIDLYEPYYAKTDQNVSNIGKIIEFFRVQINLLKNVRNYNLVYVRSHYFSYFSILFIKLLKLPIVVEINGSYNDVLTAYPSSKYIIKYIKIVSKYFYSLCDGIIVVTPQLKDYYQAILKRNDIHVVPNGANDKFFRPDYPAIHDIPSPYALFFGSLAKWQGIDTMLEAVELSEWPDEIKLVIAGKGAEENKVIEFAKKNEKIIYLGKIPYSEMPNLIANCYVSLSVKNNIKNVCSTGLSPIKVYETMSCGKPIIVSDFPFMKDLVLENKCGIVVQPECPIELAKAVQYLFTNPEVARQMGRSGRQAIESSHSWDCRVEDTYKIIGKYVFF